MPRAFRIVALASVVAAGLAPLPASASPAAEAPARPVLTAEISGDPAKPRRHFRVPNAARLGAAEAEAAYRGVGDDMARGYALSGHPAAKAYRRWRRYNRAPYRSAAHGRRFLSNYANPAAAAYGRFEQAGRFPVGSIVAKDSFSVTDGGRVLPGPLFLMEKMAAGFNYVSGDWRYTMIMPDGSIYGSTRGAGAERVGYCITCHLAREDHDHLFFIPKEFRAPAANE